MHGLELSIATIRIVDIHNSNCRYRQFSAIVDINNWNCWYQQFELCISTIWIVDIDNYE